MRFILFLRTLSMFAFLALLLAGVGALVSFMFIGNWYIGMAIMVVITVIMCFCSYYWSKEMALRSSGARIITEVENPRLFSIVRDVAGRAGVPMPEVGISREITPNAFATGRNPKNAAVVCTQGLLDLLPDDELRGVIAHEMSHIKNRDILVMSLTTAIVSIVSYLARMMWWMAIFAPMGRRDSKDSLIMLGVAIAAQILVPIAAIMVQLGISRNREYLADETGAMIIRDPRSLARALGHLEGMNLRMQADPRIADRKDRHNPANDYDCAHMWIANPLKRGSLIERLFSTHPPMQDRIERLNRLADKMGL